MNKFVLSAFVNPQLLAIQKMTNIKGINKP